MKKILIGLIIAFSLSANSQESTLTWETNVMKAVDQAIQENKPLFLFFTGSDWCGWCKRLQREVFFQPQFQKWAKKNVVLVELDFPRRTQLDADLKKQNTDLARMFGVRGYPTIWFVTPVKDDKQVNFGKLGSVGYVAGGAPAWIAKAESIIALQEK